MKNQNKAYFFAFAAILLWSTVAVPFKIGLRYFHFTHFLIISIAVSVLISFIVLVLQKKLILLKGLTKKDWLWLMAAGFINPFMYYLMLFKAYSILPAQIAQALNYTWPIMLVLLSVPFLGQKLNLKALSALLIGFVGVYLIASQGQPWPLQPSEPFGVLLAISTSLVWASFWIINTRLKTDGVLNLFVNFAFGVLFTLPVALIVPMNYSVPLTGWVAVIYTGIFEMGITFIIWLSAMRLTERTDKISNYVFLSPFMSLFFIYLMLHERIYLTTFLGLALIIGSIFLNRYFSKRLKD
ncbi:MAG: DMT family transporter [Salinivirgaceae bacterium]|jgi:drug/metabolite transporter (DMT)-like permease|nr:DMT family transporter [Salinivirgaceae bacterium]